MKSFLYYNKLDKILEYKMKSRKCNCSGKISKGKCFEEGFLINCLKCENCGQVLFTPGQAKELITLRNANEKIEAKRKIISVGSSIAALLPRKVEKLGIKPGLVDSVRVLSTNSLEIKFSKNIVK